MLGKPKQYYRVSEENGLLRVALTEQALLYYIAFVVEFMLLNLVLLSAFVALSSPLSRQPWGAIIFIGAMGVLSGVIFLVLLFRNKDSVFDRSTDRFTCGNKLVSRLGNIQHLQIHRQYDYQNKQPWYCLSVVFKQGDPCMLSKREPPATELFELAGIIAKYLGVTVRPVEESADRLVS